MKHLHQKTYDFVLNASKEERIKAISEPKWIGYSYFKNIHSKLNDLLHYPSTLRMPNLLLVGDSNNGKTALLKKFELNNKPFFDEENSLVTMPVIMIQAPPEPDEKRFYNVILESLYAPYKTTEKAERRQYRVVHLLKKMKTRILIIDEIHHVLAGSSQKQRLFLNVIKYLSNELKICLVCAGTRDAFNAIQTDPQLANRFEPKVLPRWNNNDEYLRLLASFEMLLPLKEESHLVENSLSTKILAKSEGLIGEISRILELSSILSIQSGIEKINHNILDNIDYVSPSERKKMIYKM